MSAKKVSQIFLKNMVDWCHICGHRSAPLLDIWYPHNAEHTLLGVIDEKDTNFGVRKQGKFNPCNDNYVRICKECVSRMWKEVSL